MLRNAVITFALMYFSNSIYAISLDDLNEAYSDINQHLREFESIAELDIERLQKNIDILELATQQMKFSHENFALILRTQLKAAQAINNKYLFSDLPFDVSQVQRLLNNFDDFSGVGFS